MGAALMAPPGGLSSIEFLWLFMPTVLVLYLVVRPGGPNALLAADSLGFYVWGAGARLYPFVGSIAINYVAGQLIVAAKDAGNEPRAASVTAAAVALNLLIHGIWKYAVFAPASSTRWSASSAAASACRLSCCRSAPRSPFYGISYVVDIPRGRARPMRKPTDYIQYLAFFPQLIAGPIVRYHELNHQIVPPGSACSASCSS